MNPNDGARVRQPRDAVEYRLGTVTDIGYAPYSTHVARYRLRFPTGEERTYPAAAVIACSRTDDHTALVAAFTDTCRSLRDACRIAHDYDERLSGDHHRPAPGYSRHRRDTPRRHARPCAPRRGGRPSRALLR